MLDLVTAVRFDGRVRTGRTKPCLLACTDGLGREVELVVKFSAGCERGVGALVAEAISAMLAADLDLPVPEPFLVKLEPDFIRGIPDSDIAQLAAKSKSVAFGSEKLAPAFSVVPPGKSLQKEMLTQAAEIFAFDGMIQNVDRRPENPNCLSDGRKLVIYDHELAYSMRYLLNWIPPWEKEGLQSLKTHLFYNHLKGRALDLARLDGGFRAISDERLDEYGGALPPQWSEASGLTSESLQYIRDVRNRLDAVLAEVARVIR